MSAAFWRTYALVACIWMAFHFLIYVVCMLTLKREEMGKLEELYTRPIYHIIGVLTDGIFWPISMPIKLPGIIKAIVKAFKNGIKGLKRIKMAERKEKNDE